MQRKLRGKQIDSRLSEILEEMLRLGHKLAPISRSTVLRRLGLKSRSSLLLNGRQNLIDQARKSQLHEAGLISDKKIRRKTQDEIIDGLKKEIEALKANNDNLVSKMAMIINGLQAKGLDVETILLPLRPSYSKKENKKKR